MALEATNTRVEGVMPLELELSCETCMRLGRTTARALPSAFARLAVGLGLKGVLPCAGWVGLTDSPRRNTAPERQNRAFGGPRYSGAGPPFPPSGGIQRRYNSTCVEDVPASGEKCSEVVELQPSPA
jgi:hypothetical protein